MPGKYGEELRRITRGQRGAPPGTEPTGDAREGAAKSRRRGPLLALVVLLFVAGGGWLLVRQMMSDSKLQDCVMSGRKNCAPVEGQPPGR